MCAGKLARAIIGESYLRELTTRLSYCDHECYAGNCKAADLEDALALADEIEDGETGFLIERALDEARSRQFRLTG